MMLKYSLIVALLGMTFYYCHAQEVTIGSTSSGAILINGTDLILSRFNQTEMSLMETLLDMAKEISLLRDRVSEQDVLIASLNETIVHQTSVVNQTSVTVLKQSDNIDRHETKFKELTTSSAIIGESLLINGFFRVNERAFLSGNGIGSNLYGPDRWRGGEHGCSRLMIENSTVFLNGEIEQVIEQPNLAGQAITISAVNQFVNPNQFGVENLVARVYDEASGYSFTDYVELPSTVYIPSNVTGDVTVVFNGTNAAFTSLKVERFNYPSIHVPKKLTETVELCRRYYQFYDSWTHVNARADATTARRLTMFYPVKMRAPPTHSKSSVVGSHSISLFDGGLVDSCVSSGATAACYFSNLKLDAEFYRTF